MQKKLIAAAVATLMSGAAMAQVTMYGRFDVGYSAVEAEATSATGVKTSTDTTSTGANSALTSQRLGIRVEEDLGGGMKAMGNLELGIAQDAKVGADTGGDTAAPFSTRQANLGLMTGIGSFTLGRQTVLVDDTLGIGSTGGQNNTVGELYNDGVKFNNSRSSELITYRSPNFSGFTVNLQYGKGTTENSPAAAGDQEQSELGLSASYAAGPLTVGIGYSAEERTSGSPSAVAAKPEQIAVAANYDLKVAKIYATYMDGSNETGNAALAATDIKSRSAIEIGARVPLGAVTLLASYYTGEQDNAAAASIDQDLTGYQLGVLYALSKRTTVYGLYGARSNENQTGSIKTEATQMALGVRHDF